MAAGSLIGASALGLALGCATPRASRHALDDGWDTQLHGHAGAAPSASDEAVARTPRALPPSERRPWERLAELRSLTAVPASGTSEHLGGGYAYRLHVNDAAARYRHLVGPAPLPTGALIVEELVRQGDGPPLTTFVMQKREPGFAAAAGDWEYLVLDRDGRVEQRGSLSTCVRCHIDAAHDSLFGPAR